VDQQSGHPHACVAAYTQALHKYPDLVSAYAGRASCYLQFNAGAAVKDLDRALALSPGDPGLLLTRATAHRRTGALGAAEADYLQAAASPAARDGQMAAIVQGLIGLGQPSEASAVLRLAQERYPRSSTVELAASTLSQANGDGPAAEQDLVTAQRYAASPADVTSVLSRMCAAQVSGQQYAAAVTTCQKAASLVSGNSGAYDNLSAALVQLGQLQRGIDALQSSIGAFVGSVGGNAQPAGVDGYGLANLYTALGRLYIEAHQPVLAVAAFQVARKAVPPGSPDFLARIKGYIATARRD
jgi:tetratricopeptide (TPR) repeat protein